MKEGNSQAPCQASVNRIPKTELVESPFFGMDHAGQEGEVSQIIPIHPLGVGVTGDMRPASATALNTNLDLSLLPLPIVKPILDLNLEPEVEGSEFSDSKYFFLGTPCGSSTTYHMGFPPPPPPPTSP